MTSDTKPPPTPRALLLCGACGITGAAHAAPSVPVLGAFFPAWMLCALIGIALAALLRLAGALTGVTRSGAVAPLTYPLLALLFAAGAWILFFRGP